MIWIIVIIQAIVIIKLWATVDYMIDWIDKLGDDLLGLDKLQQQIIDSNKQRIEALERR
uniref:Shock protein B n=1 Tax=Siphoviridae sp. ctzu221 TaxID=2826534 RepID=A0A8S5M112_9CAUD|nr:MAG TPA: shock protein B [Siphoviridae sp. ctzu221]